MHCPKCSSKMIQLFSSFVCDTCNPPAGAAVASPVSVPDDILHLYGFPWIKVPPSYRGNFLGATYYLNPTAIDPTVVSVDTLRMSDVVVHFDYPFVPDSDGTMDIHVVKAKDPKLPFGPYAVTSRELNDLYSISTVVPSWYPIVRGKHLVYFLSR